LVLHARHLQGWFFSSLSPPDGGSLTASPIGSLLHSSQSAFAGQIGFEPILPVTANAA
jgi:hypothetical protein